jgi:hypothetical protein
MIYSSHTSIKKHMLSFMLAQQHHVVGTQYAKYASNVYMHQTQLLCKQISVRQQGKQTHALHPIAGHTTIDLNASHPGEDPDHSIAAVGIQKAASTPPA